MSSFDTDSFGADPVATSGGSFWGLLIFLLLIAGVCVAFFLFTKKRQAHRSGLAKHNRALKIVLPKQHTETEERRDPKELIGLMESVFAAIQHFHLHAFVEKMWSGQPTFSFEIASHHGEIFFYVIAPETYLQAIEYQIHAQYPNAHIEPAYDYDIFVEKDGASAVAALTHLKQDIFPIRTYKQLDNDPLNAVTSALSKVGTGKAAIQILIQPTDQAWQHQTEEALQNVQEGKKFHAKNTAAEKAFAVAKDIGKSAVGKDQHDHQANEAHNVTKGNVRLTALQEQQAKLLVEKASKLGFKTQIRLAARAGTELEAKNQVQNMLSSFAQYQSPESNGFKPAHVDNRRLLVDYVLRTFNRTQPTIILNTEELSSVFHFPNHHMETPNIHWLGARKLSPPTNLPHSGVALGYSQYRGADIPVYIQYPDRMRHLYMIGKTGVGKTVMFQNMILQDIRNGNGVCYMDPNGDAVEWILRHIPKERAEDVILINPSDTGRPIALNLLEFDERYPEQKGMVINEVLAIFDKLYDLKATGGPMFEQYMRNAMLLIMEDPESGSTLMEIPKVLGDEKYRKMKLAKCTNPVVTDFWINEAEKAGGEAALANIVPYITSKLTQFTTNDIMRPIIGQQKSAFNFREAIDSKKIILVNLPKGLLGDMNAQLFGMIITGKIQMAAFSRQDQPDENQRIPFYLYVDEFQNFTSKTFATILSEARKYKLSLNITNQYIEQLDDDTRNAVIGNAGTILAWRIGAGDAEFLQKEFDPLEIEDMVNTEKYNFYLKLLIDGTPSKPFNAMAYAPDPHENVQIGEAIRQLSRLKYGRDREVVEAEIRARTKSVV